MASFFVLKTISKMLGKALVYLKEKDNLAKQEFKSLPEKLKVTMKIFDSKNLLEIYKKGDKLYFSNKSKDEFKNEITIIFKNKKSASLCLFGRIGVRESFCRHDIVLAGNINTAIVLVRIIEIAEYYLFPRFITKKFLPKIKKQFSSLKLYWFLLFGSVKKIQDREIDNIKAKNKQKLQKIEDNNNNNSKNKVKTANKTKNRAKTDKNKEKSDE